MRVPSPTRFPSISRPLTDRDYIIVQDYVRVLGGTDGNDDGHNWFFTYNHDFEHPYFVTRPDFVRASAKYQGMIGVLGDSGKTRLTWLVNFDLGGLIPTSFTTQLLIELMVYPVATIEALEKYKQQSSKHNIDSLRLLRFADALQFMTSTKYIMCRYNAHSM